MLHFWNVFDVSKSSKVCWHFYMLSSHSIYSIISFMLCYIIIYYALSYYIIFYHYIDIAIGIRSCSAPRFVPRDTRHESENHVRECEHVPQFEHNPDCQHTAPGLRRLRAEAQALSPCILTKIVKTKKT